MEKGIKEEDGFGLNGSGVQQNWLASFMIKTIAVKSWLDHDKRVADILMVENMTIESCLIRGIVEDLQELGTTKMEHKLWVKCEVLLQSK